MSLKMCLFGVRQVYLFCTFCVQSPLHKTSKVAFKKNIKVIIVKTRRTIKLKLKELVLFVYLLFYYTCKYHETIEKVK